MISLTEAGLIEPVEELSEYPRYLYNWIFVLSKSQRMCSRKNMLAFAILLLSKQLCCAQDPSANDSFPPAIIKGYRLVWNDEFNKDGKPDTLNWVFENGFVRNEELQWYQPENARCMHGSLVIECNRQQLSNKYYKAGSSDWRLNRPTAEYTSASLQTRGLHQWEFGRFEIRAKIDTTDGSWPAIWTLGVNKSWPSNGEIDIMEFYRIKGIPVILANTAWGTNKPNVARWHTEKRPLASFLKDHPGWADKFHVWRMDWDKEAVRLFLDDQLMNTTLLDQTLNADSSNPFLQNHFLLLNLAIGGNGGNPARSPMPLKFEVDYVRVYQMDNK